jgi:hypothetical protein
MIELVAFVGLGGVNNVFSHVSLILVATSSVFAKSLLTSFLALVHRTCAPMFLDQNVWVSQKQDACGNLVLASLPLNFPFSAFFEKRLLWTSVGLNMIHTFLSHKILKLTLSCVSQATQYGWGLLNPWSGVQNPYGAGVSLRGRGLGPHMSNQGTPWHRFLA